MLNFFHGGDTLFPVRVVTQRFSRGGEALRDPSITVAKETTCLFPSYLLTVFTLHIFDLFTFVDAVKN